jgi:predicted nucleic acid-binding protein
MIVVDASALFEVLLQSPVASMVERRLLAPGVTLHAPHLIDAEVAQALRRYAALGQVDAGRGRELVEDLADFPLRRYPHRRLLPRIWELRHNLTAYDAAYVALAESLGAPLVTRDRRLAAAAAAGSEAAVEVV